MRTKKTTRRALKKKLVTLIEEKDGKPTLQKECTYEEAYDYMAKGYTKHFQEKKARGEKFDAVSSPYMMSITNKGTGPCTPSYLWMIG